MTGRRGNPAGAAAFGEEGRRKGAVAGVEAVKAGADAFADQMRPAVHRARAAGAVSLRELADALNQAGVLTRRKGLWNAATVQRLLRRLEGEGGGHPPG